MQKQSVWILWLGSLLAIFLGSGWVSTAGSVVFWLLVVAHLVEFFVKRDVFERAGGSMGNHFLQTLIYGILYWKPLEEGLGSEQGPSD